VIGLQNQGRAGTLQRIMRICLACRQDFIEAVGVG
jgi:hypothetical protein